MKVFCLIQKYQPFYFNIIDLIIDAVMELAFIYHVKLLKKYCKEIQLCLVNYYLQIHNHPCKLL
jgi:hypothetical protein